MQVAGRYREGRVFLVGDAAHRFPPSGGLGLNTGIQEAHDLAGRLARVEAGAAPAPLPGGYEAACRPAVQSNADASFESLKRLAEVTRVIGECPDLPALERLLASMAAAARRDLARAIEIQRSHFLSDGRSPGEVPPALRDAS